MRVEGVAVALLALWDAKVCVAFAFDADNHVQCRLCRHRLDLCIRGRARQKKNREQKKRGDGGSEKKGRVSGLGFRVSGLGPRTCCAFRDRFRTLAAA